MSIEIETIAVGLAVLTPIYSMMWKMVQSVFKMEQSIDEMKNKLANCKYCVRATNVDQ